MNIFEPFPEPSTQIGAVYGHQICCCSPSNVPRFAFFVRFFAPQIAHKTFVKRGEWSQFACAWKTLQLGANHRVGVNLLLWCNTTQSASQFKCSQNISLFSGTKLQIARSVTRSIFDGWSIPAAATPRGFMGLSAPVVEEAGTTLKPRSDLIRDPLLLLLGRGFQSLLLPPHY